MRCAQCVRTVPYAEQPSREKVCEPFFSCHQGSAAAVESFFFTFNGGILDSGNVIGKSRAGFLCKLADLIESARRTRYVTRAFTR